MKAASSPRLSRLGYLHQRILHQKVVGEHDMKTDLRRCLSTPQLTLLGMGNTIGVGIYVMLGVIAKENAGPSTVLSFVAAMFVTMMNALVFAEFSTYIPHTGASYIYIYRVFGEFAAFLCGWVMIITYAFASSVGARAWSGMLDSFFNNTIQAHTVSVLGNIQFGLPFAESLDVLAFFFQIFVVIIVSCNVLCSSVINTILGILTSSVLVFVFVMGLVYGHGSNLLNEDHGGFFPFGVAGVIKGATLALYALSGFEVIAISAEEAKNPAKSIPRAIISELLLVCTIYVGAAIGMLMLIPYWEIDLRSPLPSAFEYNGILWGKIVVVIGPLFGITNLQMLGVYGFSRVLYRMAKDGLFMDWFLKVNKRTGVPLNSVFFVGFFTSIGALLFDLSYIVRETVILMLLANIAVAAALIKLKITESQKFLSGVKPNQTEKTLPKSEREYYDQEVVVSEYETCESTESVDVDGVVPYGDNLLVDVTNDQLNGHCSGDGPDVSSISEQNQFLIQQKVMNEIQVKQDSDVNKADDEETEDDRPGAGPKVLLSKPEPETLIEIRDKKYASAAALFVSPLIPGILSVNVVMFLHWAACFFMAVQINFGWRDLWALQPASVAALSVLMSVALFLSFLLGTQCGETQNSGFKTPLMPLVPTLSILSSSLLLFSSGDLNGFIETVILLTSGTVFYIVMVLINYHTQPRSTEDSEQRKGLVGGSGDDADDEIESDEF